MAISDGQLDISLSFCIRYPLRWNRTACSSAITGDVANEHTTIHQWCHKDPFGERIGPGNAEYSIMLPLQAFLHMMPPAHLTLQGEVREDGRGTIIAKGGTCVSDIGDER